MAVASYGSSTRTSGVVRIVKDFDTDLAGRHVLVVEDIVDSGLTLAFLLRNLAARQPAEPRGVRLAGQGRRGHRPELAYVGFRIPTDFVVGYGLDIAERYRNLNCIRRLGGPTSHAFSCQSLNPATLHTGRFGFVVRVHLLASTAACPRVRMKAQTGRLVAADDA